MFFIPMVVVVRRWAFIVVTEISIFLALNQSLLPLGLKPPLSQLLPMEE